MVKSCFLPSIYQLSSNFVKQLFRIQIQKGGKVLLWKLGHQMPSVGTILTYLEATA